MDQETLVMDRITETRKLIKYLSEEQHLEVTAAFWMDALDDDEWTLQIVSPKVNEIGMRGGFSAIRRTLENHPEIHLDFDVILPQRTDDPAVLEVLEFIDRYDAPNATKERGIFLKGHFVERAYIYPIDLDVGVS